MTITLYGIPNCDTVKKARVWLADQQLDFVFHDFKKQGLDRATAAAWLRQLPWDVVINRKGTTWRGLPDARKAAVVDADSALDLLLEFTSVIKRPVLDTGVGNGTGATPFSVGFSDTQYRQIFSL